jgi:hypothetical protein
MWSPEQIGAYEKRRFQRRMDVYGDKVTKRDDYCANLGRYTRWDVPPLTHAVRTGGTRGEKGLSSTSPRYLRAAALARAGVSQLGICPLRR